MSESTAHFNGDYIPQSEAASMNSNHVTGQALFNEAYNLQRERSDGSRGSGGRGRIDDCFKENFGVPMEEGEGGSSGGRLDCPDSRFEGDEPDGPPEGAYEVPDDQSRDLNPDGPDYPGNPFDPDCPDEPAIPYDPGETMPEEIDPEDPQFPKLDPDNPSLIPLDRQQDEDLEIFPLWRKK